MHEDQKHFQTARLILKYDPCAVKRVDAEEQGSAQRATSNILVAAGLRSVLND